MPSFTRQPHLVVLVPVVQYKAGTTVFSRTFITVHLWITVRVGNVVLMRHHERLGLLLGLGKCPLPFQPAGVTKCPHSE